MAPIKNNKKLDEILELEKAYNITLNEYSNELEEEHYLPRNAYVLNSVNEIIALSITDSGIEDVNPISKIESLNILSLLNNNITNIEPLTSNLKKLEFLYLGANKIKQISSLSNIPNLIRLSIWDNPIEDYANLSDLIKLKTLACQSTKMTNLLFTKELNKITQLYASDNLISNIDILIGLPNLNEIMVDGNNIRFIPTHIAERFSWLADSLNEPYKIKNRIAISNNPLEFPPLSVIALGPIVTKEYYDTAEQYGHTALSEGRIIVIGDGASGKSSLIEKMLYNSFTIGREQTNGIKIDNLSLQHPEDKRNLTFHFWDFGGQEIQHAVHKFFFTEGCLYVLVLDNRKEEEPEYWLQQIESLGGKASVLVVFNKQDENNAETADRKYLKEKYPNIVGFYNTSCKTGFGIEDFKNKLYSEVVKLRTVSEQFPNNWLAVKKAIEEHTSGTQHYLNYDAYQEICKQNNLVTEHPKNCCLNILIPLVQLPGLVKMCICNLCMCLTQHG